MHPSNSQPYIEPAVFSQNDPQDLSNTTKIDPIVFSHSELSVFIAKNKGVEIEKEHLAALLIDYKIRLQNKQ